MRKLFTLLLSFAFLAGIQAQTNLFSADFESGMPSTITLEDRDGQEPYSGMVNYGFNSTIPWVVFSGFAMSHSYYTPAGTSDDWMILPEVTIQENTYLTWDAFVGNPSYPDGYSIYLIEGSTETEIFSIAEENGDYTSRKLNLSDYAGRTAKIAFVNNSTDMYVLFIDNISIDVLNEFDYKVLEVANPGLMAEGEYGIGATIQNVGYGTVSKVKLQYTINDTLTTVHNFPVNLGVFETKTVYFWRKWNATLGTHSIEIELINVNDSIADANAANDKANKSVEVKSGLTKRMSLFEVGTSVTCPPCATYVPPYLEMVDSIHGAISMAYQGEYNPSGSNHPMYNFSKSAVDTRISYYGLQGWPSTWINGIGDEEEGGGLHPGNVTEYDVYANTDTVSYINLCIEHSGINASNEASINVKLTSYEDLNLANAKLRIAVVENDIEYSTAPGSNGEKHFTSVMRYMLPNATGTDLPTTIAANTPFEVTETVTLDLETVEAENLHVIAFIQDDETQEILQANITESALSATSGTHCNWLLNNVELPQEITEVVDFIVYPTTTSSLVTIEINSDDKEAGVLNIYNQLGQRISTQTIALNKGLTKTQVNVSHLPEGQYILETISGSIAGRSKFQVIK